MSSRNKCYIFYEATLFRRGSVHKYGMIPYYNGIDSLLCEGVPSHRKIIQRHIKGGVCVQQCTCYRSTSILLLCTILLCIIVLCTQLMFNVHVYIINTFQLFGKFPRVQLS